MQGIGIKGAIEPLGEGLALWRGSRLAARMMRGEIAAMETLSERERFDLGLFSMREQQRLAKGGAVSQSRLGTANMIRILSGELPAAEMDALALELQQEAQALEEVAGMEPAPGAKPAVVADAEKQADFAGLTDQEHVTNTQDVAESEAKAPRPEPAAPAAENTPVPAPTVTKTDGKPFPIEANLPERPGAWNMTLIGKDGQPYNVTFDIGGFLDSGSFQHVYELSGSPTGLPTELAEVLRGKRLVLKILRSTVREGDGDLAPLLPQTMTRQKQSWDLLNRGGKQVVPHAPFQVFENEGFMVQEFLEFQDGKLDRLKPELRTDPRALPRRHRRPSASPSSSLPSSWAGTISI